MITYVTQHQLLKVVRTPEVTKIRIIFLNSFKEGLSK